MVATPRYHLISRETFYFTFILYRSPFCLRLIRIFSLIPLLSNVVWEKHSSSSKPLWSREPNSFLISTLVCPHLGIPESTWTSSDSTICHWCFESLYPWNRSTRHRVTWPQYPASVVIRRFLYQPWYCATSENKLGFEWILMEEMSESEDIPSSPAALVPWEWKKVVPWRSTWYNCERYHSSLTEVFTFAPAWKDTAAIDTDPQFVVGPLVSINFF